MTQKEILTAIQNLNSNKDSTTWNFRTQQLAPHKPFLLLSIMDGITVGLIEQPKIKLTQDLIETFFRYWNLIMGKDRKTTIALPFFHMRSEPFWELRYHEGMQPYKNSPSLGGIIKRIKHARINEQLFTLMQKEKGRQIISSSILESYFSKKVQKKIQHIQQINIGAYRYAQHLDLLASEPFQKYHIDKNDNPSYSWQQKQQRKYGFGIKVRENYTHRCAICRAKVQTPSGESLVEGAHIIPWSKSKNDDPRNGLALCKTHHWMFDTHLLTVQPNYQIKLSNWLKREGDQIDNTIDWDSKKILLPTNKQFLPNKKALEDHYQKFNSVN